MICVTLLAFPRFWKMLRLSDRLYCVREDSCRTGDGSLPGLFVPYRSWQIFVFPVSAVWANRGKLRFILPQQAYPAKTSKRPHNGADAQRMTRIALIHRAMRRWRPAGRGLLCNSNDQQRTSHTRGQNDALLALARRDSTAHAHGRSGETTQRVCTQNNTPPAFARQEIYSNSNDQQRASLARAKQRAVSFGTEGFNSACTWKER